MPFTIRKYKDGFRVCKTYEPSKCFSKKPLTKSKAEKQKKAIIISELKGNGKREELIEKAEEKVGKIPDKYVPKSLSIPDLKKQLESIIKEIKRPKLKSFKSKESSWTEKAKKYFGEDRSLQAISKKLGTTKKREKEILKGLKEIYSKGEGAYFSSGSRPNQSPESWAQARVYSVLFGGPSRKIDQKIVEKYDIPLIKIEGSGSSKSKSVREYLKDEKIDPEIYLHLAKENAQMAGYDPDKLFFSDKKPFKLMYEKEPDDFVHFGRVPYGDFIYYLLRENKGLEKPETANKKREGYLARAKNIKGDWENNPFSKNNLAIKILW